MSYTVRYHEEHPDQPKVQVGGSPLFKPTDAATNEKFFAVRDASELARVPGRVLVALYNRAFPQAPVKKFATQAIAAKRVWAVLPELAGTLAQAFEKPRGPEKMTGPEPLPPVKKVLKRELIASRVLHLVKKDNPRRPGTRAHGVYALYRDGMTVAEFYAAGGKSGDLNWDLKRGHVVFIPASSS